MNRVLAGAIAAILLFGAAPAAFAQSAPSAAAQPSPQRLELARQVIDATGVRKNIEPELRAMLNQIGISSERVSDKDIQDIMVKQMPKMIDAFVLVYAQVYTETELAGILDFYHSPAGQATLAKGPQVAQALIPAIVNVVISANGR